MNRLVKIISREDIFPEYRNSPIDLLLQYHNLGLPFENVTNAQMLIGMCMDNRKYLRIPDNFAFIIRTGGANLRYSEFKISYAISVGEVSSLALIAHNRCGMVNIIERKNQFVQGLIDRAGWDRISAEEHFRQYSPMFEIGNEIDFLLSEVNRLRLRYPKILMAPLYYNVDDNLLYLVKEGRNT
ncbi:MAG: carbonic anhydrase [Chlorobiaceae bacterium]|nr:carbonic anhydrase [Chlorobiaceae bacterium]